MGDLADMMCDGTLCSLCGGFMEDQYEVVGEHEGSPVLQKIEEPPRLNEARVCGGCSMLWKMQIWNKELSKGQTPRDLPQWHFKHPQFEDWQKNFGKPMSKKEREHFFEVNHTKLRKKVHTQFLKHNGMG